MISNVSASPSLLGTTLSQKLPSVSRGEATLKKGVR
jgi:hypothetical protein